MRKPPFKHNFHIKHYKTLYLVEDHAQYLHTWTVLVCKTQITHHLLDCLLTAHDLDCAQSLLRSRPRKCLQALNDILTVSKTQTEKLTTIQRRMGKIMQGLRRANEFSNKDLEQTMMTEEVGYQIKKSKGKFARRDV